MLRQINQPVPVTVVRDEQWGLRPAQFTWRQSRYRVIGVLDRWAEVGRWWEREPEMTVWRVLLHNQGVCELGMMHTQPPSWKLLVIYD